MWQINLAKAPILISIVLICLVIGQLSNANIADGCYHLFTAQNNSEIKVYYSNGVRKLKWDASKPKPILNLGGTGEIPDAINLNNLAGLAAGQSDKTIPNLVVGDMQKLPFENESMSQVIGNKLPTGRINYDLVAQEAFRVLEPGGKVRLHSMTPITNVFEQALRKAGFQVEIRSGAAFGVKPSL